MPIPRLHLFELEDQPWFPAVLRDLVTDYLRFVEKKFALHRPCVALMCNVLRDAKLNRVVDLCSGGGGPILLLHQELADKGRSVSFVLTDRFPNQNAFRQAATSGGGAISFVTEPVDARSVPRGLTGFRTLFNAFHHFTPDDAVGVLRDAVDAGQPIGVFEIPERTLRTLLPMILLTPLLVLLTTPFIRPFRWRRLFWTYILPLAPLTCWWDGLISQLRAYTPAELERMAQSAGANHYVWQVGQTPLGTTPGYLTYLIGYPKPDEAAGELAVTGELAAAGATEAL